GRACRDAPAEAPEASSGSPGRRAEGWKTSSLVRRLPQPPLDRLTQQIGGEVEVLDGLDLPTQLAQGEAEDDGGREILPGGHPQRLVLGVDLAEQAAALRLGVRAQPGLLRGAFGRDEPALHLGFDLRLLGLGRAAGLLQAVGALLADQLLLPLRQLDLGGQLVLLDRPLFLDRHRAALEGRLIGFLLYRLTGRRLQRLFELRGRRDAVDQQADQREAAGLDLGIAPQRLLHRRLDHLRPRLHGFDHRHAQDMGARRLLRALAPQAGQALQRLFEPGAAVEREGEVHPRRRLLGLRATVAQRALDGDLLEVPRQL